MKSYQKVIQKIIIRHEKICKVIFYSSHFMPFKIFSPFFMKTLFHAAGISPFLGYSQWYVCECLRRILCRSAPCNERQIHFFESITRTWLKFLLLPQHHWRAHFTIYYHLHFCWNLLILRNLETLLRLAVQRVLRERRKVSLLVLKWNFIIRLQCSHLFWFNDLFKFDLFLSHEIYLT